MQPEGATSPLRPIVFLRDFSFLTKDTNLTSRFFLSRCFPSIFLHYFYVRGYSSGRKKGTKFPSRLRYPRGKKTAIQKKTA